MPMLLDHQEPSLPVPGPPFRKRVRSCQQSIVDRSWPSILDRPCSPGRRYDAPLPDELAFRKAVGRRLQDARNRAGKSLDQAAEHLGMSRGAVGHWETGVNPVDIGKLRRLARFYKTTVVALVSDGMTAEDVLALAAMHIETYRPGEQQTSRAKHQRKDLASA